LGVAHTKCWVECFVAVYCRVRVDIIIRKALARVVNCERKSYSTALADRLFVWRIGFMGRRVIGRSWAFSRSGVSEHGAGSLDAMALGFRLVAGLWRRMADVVWPVLGGGVRWVRFR